MNTDPIPDPGKRIPTALRPVLVGAGEHLLSGVDGGSLGYECAGMIACEPAPI